MSRRSVFILVLTLLSTTPAFTQSSRLDELEQANRGAASRDERLELARLYVEAGRYYEAAEVAKRLLAASPEDTAAAELRDRALAGLKQTQNARIAEAEALAARKDLTNAQRLEIADTFFQGGRYLSAAEYYRKVPASSMTTESRLRHARALSWSGDHDNAERIYLDIISSNPDPAIELEYGRVLSWMGASRAALSRLSALYERDKSEPVVVALANARSWSGDREGALTLLRDYTAQNPGATEASALIAEIESGPQLRIERVERMIEIEPYNLALRMERARLMLDAQRYAEALRTIEFIEEHTPERVEGLAELRREVEQRRDAEVAILKARLASVDGESSNPDELHNLAKAYVAISEYDTAIRLYDRYLSMRPDDVNARIEYARVLSWDERYRAARRAYSDLIEAHPERADLRLEYAQILSYDDDYIPAIRTLRSLTDLSDNPRSHLYADVPQRAHFNLGQIYRWFGWNEHAVMEQNDAIALDGSYTPARRELDLVRHLRPATIVDARYTFAEDANDFTLRRYDIEAQKWNSQRTAFDVLVGRHEFDRAGEGVEATALAVGGRYRFQDRLSARARLGLNNYSDDLGTRPYWGLGAEFLPSIQSRFAIDYSHYDLVYDVFTVESLREDPLHIDDLRAHWDYKTGGHWAYIADASYGVVSDDNTRLAAHGLVSYRILKSPFVALKADSRYLSYDFRTNRYWSPSDYRTLAGVLHVGHNFRERLFWDAELKYGRSFEGDRESDFRAIEARVTVPITDALDLVGAWADGRSGRIEPFIGGDDDVVNYWQRRFYVGVRVKRLFSGADRRDARNLYYYDNQRLQESSLVGPLGERR